MAMPIDNLMIDAGPDLHYSPEWHTTIESHLRWLIEHPTTVVQNIDPQNAYKYEADLWGLLSNETIPMYMHWIIMRMNGLVTPTDFTADMTTLLIPRVETISSIRNVFSTGYIK